MKQIFLIMIFLVILSTQIFSQSKVKDISVKKASTALTMAIILGLGIGEMMDHNIGFGVSLLFSDLIGVFFLTVFFLDDYYINLIEKKTHLISFQPVYRAFFLSVGLIGAMMLSISKIYQITKASIILRNVIYKDSKVFRNRLKKEYFLSKRNRLNHIPIRGYINSSNIGISLFKVI